MPFLNVEIKARCTDPQTIREYLAAHGAERRGTDHQTDTYFNVPNGRLKLREGNIENNLIFYERADQAGPKQSHFQLVAIPDAITLKEMLSRSLGVKIAVIKTREIWFIANVKFHIDEVPGLGAFVEIEASNMRDDLPESTLRSQCNHYLEEFGIVPADLVNVSYSDLLMEA